MGYCCDCCGVEVFDYPVRRLCEPCEQGMTKNVAYICDKCGRATLTEGLCLACKSLPPVFEKGVSPFVYHNTVAGMINRMKTTAPYLAHYFGEKIVDLLRKKGNAEDCVVTFVPLGKERLRQRGYNQAELLAETVADGLGLPLCETMVCVGEKGMQKHLSAAVRAKNVQGMYRVTDRKAVKGKTVFLIDDVMTTGATGNECAARLKKAGANKVYFVTAASLPERR